MLSRTDTDELDLAIRGEEEKEEEEEDDDDDDEAEVTMGVLPRSEERERE